MHKKIAYICAPLTELPNPGWLLKLLFLIMDFLGRFFTGKQRQFRFTKYTAKRLYSALGDVCEQELGHRAFVPHECFDPEKHAHFSPAEVDWAERFQVCHGTSVLVVVAIEPTWGGGIEVEMAYRSGVPVIVLKLPKKVSRLLLGNPAVKQVVEFTSPESAVQQLRLALRELRGVIQEDDIQMSLSM